MQLSKRTPRNKSDIAPTLTRRPQKINQVSHSMKNTKKTLKRRTAWAQIDGSMTMSCKLLSLSPFHRRLRFFPFFVCPLFKRNPIPSSRHRPKSDCFSFHSLSFSVKYKKSCEPRELSGMDQSSIQQLLCCVSVSLIWEPPCRPTALVYTSLWSFGRICCSALKWSHR